MNLLRELLISWHSWCMVLADVRSQKYASKRDQHAIRMSRLVRGRSPAQVAKMERERGLA